MNGVLVCTAAYEAGRRFVPHYVAALMRAAAGRELAVLLAIDDLVEPAAAFAPLSRRMETRFVGAPEGSSPAEVRSTMLEAARRSGFEFLVLLDLDDLPDPSLIERHLAALAGAEISYGDLRIVDAAGRPIAPSFYAGAGVPGAVTSADALAERNFLGFSNSALRRAALGADGVAIPPHLVAADWWFFTTLVETGARARRAEGVVADYRLHEANALGGRPDPALPALLRRARMMRAHYAALPANQTRSRADRRIAALVEAIEREPDRLAPLAAEACARPGVWFDDVARLALAVEREFA